MYIDFSQLFHQSSKDRYGQGSVHIPADQSDWPVEWRTRYFKQYPRLPHLALSKTTDTSALRNILNARHSSRDFTATPLSDTDISSLLKYSAGVTQHADGRYHRAQASGGARYPIEVYPIVFRGSEHIPAGVYHYDVKQHGLEQLWERAFTADDISTLFTYPWAQHAAMALVLTGVFHRSQMKYGERGYRHVLIEAGSIVQNVYLAAAELGVKCCAIDGVHEQTIEQLLDIDGYAESAVVSIVLGK